MDIRASCSFALLKLVYWTLFLIASQEFGTRSSFAYDSMPGESVFSPPSYSYELRGKKNSLMISRTRKVSGRKRDGARESFIRVAKPRKIAVLRHFAFLSFSAAAAVHVPSHAILRSAMRERTGQRSSFSFCFSALFSI